jgi:hypothetical protein
VLWRIFFDCLSFLDIQTERQPRGYIFCPPATSIGSCISIYWKIFEIILTCSAVVRLLLINGHNFWNFEDNRKKCRTSLESNSKRQQHIRPPSVIRILTSAHQTFWMHYSFSDQLICLAFGIDLLTLRPSFATFNIWSQSELRSTFVFTVIIQHAERGLYSSHSMS